jgi:hypothetical protein
VALPFHPATPVAVPAAAVGVWPDRSNTMAPMLARLALAALAAVLLALALGGCGDGTLSAGDLGSRATKICDRVQKATDRIAVPNGPGEAERFLAQGLAVIRPAVVELAKLKPPKDMHDRYAEAIGLMRRQIKLISASVASIHAGSDPIRSFRSLQQGLAPLTSLASTSWRALKLPACAPR